MIVDVFAKNGKVTVCTTTPNAHGSFDHVAEFYPLARERGKGVEGALERARKWALEFSDAERLRMAEVALTTATMLDSREVLIVNLLRDHRRKFFALEVPAAKAMWSQNPTNTQRLVECSLEKPFAAEGFGGLECIVNLERDDSVVVRVTADPKRKVRHSSCQAEFIYPVNKARLRAWVMTSAEDVLKRMKADDA